MGEGFVLRERALVKIHCHWPEEPAVFSSWQLWGEYHFIKSK